MMKGEDKTISGWKNKVQVGMSHVMPDKIVANQIRKQQEEVVGK